MGLADMPAYFLSGPHGGETMMIGGNPSTFLFPVARPFPMLWENSLSPYDFRCEVDTYEFVRPVLLYRYRGRY